MAQVILNGWRPGLRKVSLAKLLQARTDLSLTSAKRCVDRLLKGEIVTVTLGSTKEAARLAEEVTNLGVKSEVRNNDQKQ